VTDPLGRRTEYAYDGFGRMIEALDPLGGETQFAYDANGSSLALRIERWRDELYIQ
jgi:YD repeat-containing protein